MNNIVTDEQLGNMTAEQLMELDVSDVDKLLFTVQPEGLYAGSVKSWETPNAENNKSWVPTVIVAAAVELENPEEESQVVVGGEVSCRYGMEYPKAFRSMRTAWDEFFVTVGGGKIGNAMAQGNGTQITFRIEHRYTYKDAAGKALPKPKGPYMDIKDVKMA